jgi:hypothetical protein
MDGLLQAPAPPAEAFFVGSMPPMPRKTIGDWKKGTAPICRNGPEAGTDAQRSSLHKCGLSPFSTLPIGQHN